MWSEDGIMVNDSLASKRKNRRPGDEYDKPDRWVVSYADFITLLFAFFTTMYAISHVDLGKLERFAGSMKSAFNAAGSGLGGTSVIEGVRPITPADLELERIVRAGFSKFDIIDGITVYRTERGVSVSFEDSILFESGSASIRKDGRVLLDAVAGLIKTTQNMIVIEGHTDNIPIRSVRYGSNWELSAARATSVLQHLVQDYGVRPERLSVSGYGEFRPIATNSTPGGRAKNRRVEIIFVTGEH